VIEIPRTILSYTSSARTTIDWLNALKIATKENTYVRLEIAYDNRIRVGMMVRLIGFGKYSVVGIVKRVETKINFSSGLKMSIEVFSDYLVDVVPKGTIDKTTGKEIEDVVIKVFSPSDYARFDPGMDYSNTMAAQPVETAEDLKKWHDILLGRQRTHKNEDRKAQLKINQQLRLEQRKYTASMQTYVNLKAYSDSMNSGGITGSTFENTQRQ